MKRIISMLLLMATLFTTVVFSVPTSAASVEIPAKTESTFFGSDVIAVVQKNIEENRWVASKVSEIVDAAKFWKERTYDELWEYMYSSTLDRAWFCTTEAGTCPDCGATVGGHGWVIDPAVLFKMACPNCGSLFPKNDFEAYYESGLDEHRIFREELADKTLLVNSEDGSKNFVDDGHGVVINGIRYRFIEKYLLNGLFMINVRTGIECLANAYIITGDVDYARRAAILLDRLADLYPDFDFMKQGTIYEGQASADGSVGYWDETNDTINRLATAYDKIFEGMAGDTELVNFLNQKAIQYKLDNKKETIADIRKNIENGIFIHTLNKPGLVHRNFPMQEVVLTIVKAVLNYDYFTSEAVDSDTYNGTSKGGTFDDGIYESVKYVIDNGLGVDGWTGEKSITGYGAKTVASSWQLIARIAEKDANLIPSLIIDKPKFLEGINMYINLWANETYFPNNGDSGDTFGLQNYLPIYDFVGENFGEPSIIELLCTVYDVTKEAKYLQLAGKCANYALGSGSNNKLPGNILTPDLKTKSSEYSKILKALPSSYIEQESTNYEEWHIATIVTGEGAKKRYIMLDYDSGGGHGHFEAMNTYIYYKKADILPDYGYPPIAYDNGWNNKYIYWYRHPLSHNTVTVDGKKDPQVKLIKGNGVVKQYGSITLWGIGEAFKTMGATTGNFLDYQYDRSLTMIDIDDSDSYILDIFRVSGSGEHVKSLHSAEGALTVNGLTFADGGKINDSNVLMNNISTATGVSKNWNATFNYKNLKAGDITYPHTVITKYTDLSNGLTSVIKGDAVAFKDGQSVAKEFAVPQLLLVNANGSFTNFVGVFEPHTKEAGAKVASITRLESELTDLSGVAATDRDVAVSVVLLSGTTDLYVSIDKTKYNETETKNGVKIASLGFETDAENAFVRKDKDGNIVYISIVNGSYVKLGEKEFKVNETTAFAEIKVQGEIACLTTSDVAKDKVTVTGYTLVDSLPESTPATTPDTAPGTTPDTTPEEDGEDSSLILWIIIGVVALAAIGGGVFFLTKKKK